MKFSEYKLGFIGFGHLAKILFRAIDAAKLLPRSQILFRQKDPHKMKENEQKFKITATSLENLVQTSDLLLLAIRPNQTKQVLLDLAPLGVEGKKIISVVAGLRFSFYQKFLGKDVEILRAMPNLASAVGEGMTALCYSSSCSTEFKSFGHIFFQSMGSIVELDEKLMDIAAGISGSGPGFVFRFIEAMARIGEKEGISYEKALSMAAQTFLGAAKLIQKGHLPQDLIEQIAVPNGTTEAGFKVMRQLQLEPYFQQVIEASTQRSRELSDEFS